MVISNGHNTKNLVLYTPAEPDAPKNSTGGKKVVSMIEVEDEEVRLVLTIGQALQLKMKSEDEVITSFMNDPCFISESNQ